MIHFTMITLSNYTTLICFVGTVGLGEYAYFQFHVGDNGGSSSKQPLRFKLFGLDSSDLDLYLTFKNTSATADPVHDIPGRQMFFFLLAFHLISCYNLK